MRRVGAKERQHPPTRRSQTEPFVDEDGDEPADGSEPRDADEIEPAKREGGRQEDDRPDDQRQHHRPRAEPLPALSRQARMYAAVKNGASAASTSDCSRYF